MDEAAEWMRMDDDGFIGLVGPVFHRPFTGPVGHFRFQADPKHRNRSGFVHGGMLMAFADRALGSTARQMDPARRLATVQLDVHFMSPGRIGDTVEMECRIVRTARSLVFLDGTITARETVLATARGVWKRFS